MGNYWRRPLGAKLILLLAVAFLLEMLAPWQRICAVTSEAGERTCGWRTAYEGSQFGTYMALLALAIVIWELLPVIWPRLSMRGWPTATITAVLGGALVVATLVKMIDDNEFQTVWAWIGFAIALAIMFLALIRVRYRWGTRGGDEPDDVPRAVSAPPPPLATGESREPPPE